jgi:putative ABC transport system permease protein
MLSGIRIALRAIVRNGLRSVLTVLGILIGVAAVVTVTALGAGARDSVGKQIEAAGSNLIMVVPQNSNASGARSLAAQGQRLTDDDGRAIWREAVSVKAVAPMLRARAQVVHGEHNASTNVVGSTAPFFVVRNWPLRSGEVWTEQDETLKAKVCVIGSTIARKVFPGEDPVGQILRIGRHAYRVIGVLESKGEGSFGDQDDIVVMPIGSMRARVVKTAPGFAGVLMISATSPETTDRAVAQIQSILRQRHRIAEGREPDFGIRTQKEFQAMQGVIYGILTMLLVLIAGISLIVGGIGVMNIMLVSVTERTREIGIRMAIGAREGDIRTQFLVEAVVLALLGGLAGALLGIGLIKLLSFVLEMPMGIDPTALTVSIAVSALTGVLFGFFPARRASLKDPIEALRHE